MRDLDAQIRRFLVDAIERARLFARDVYFISEGILTGLVIALAEDVDHEDEIITKWGKHEQ